MSRLLADLVSQGDLVPMECGGRVASLPHFLNADEILVFERASKRNLKVIVDAFKDYGCISSQQVSWEKSYIYFRPRTPSIRRQLLAFLCSI